MDESIVDLWLGQPGGSEGPAHGYNNSIESCYSAMDAWCPVDPDGVDECLYEDALFRDFIVDNIQAHDFADPLFTFYSPHIAHEPLQVPRSYYDKFPNIDEENRRRYHAMVNFMDDAVRDVVNTVVAKGVWDNTLVIFSADNGGPIYRSGDPGANNWPLKGGKASNWDGGIRCACVFGSVCLWVCGSSACLRVYVCVCVCLCVCVWGLTPGSLLTGDQSERVCEWRVDPRAATGGQAIGSRHGLGLVRNDGIPRRPR